MSGRYGDPRRAPQSVPRALAVELVRERDAYAEALRRERVEVERLRAGQEALGARHGELGSECEALRAQLEVLRGERDALRTRLESVEARVVEQPEPDAPELVRLERRVEGLLEDITRLRRNHDRELDARAREGARDALTGVLEVRDNMSRALELLAGDGGPWEQGFVGVLEQVDTALARVGVRRFGAVGERFDPTVHEAIGVEKVEGVEAGTLLRVERAGFRFEEGEALLRSALVVVAA